MCFNPFLLTAKAVELAADGPQAATVATHHLVPNLNAAISAPAAIAASSSIVPFKLPLPPGPRLMSLSKRAALTTTVPSSSTLVGGGTSGTAQHLVASAAVLPAGINIAAATPPPPSTTTSHTVAVDPRKSAAAAPPSFLSSSHLVAASALLQLPAITSSEVLISCQPSSSSSKKPTAPATLGDAEEEQDLKQQQQHSAKKKVNASSSSSSSPLSKERKDVISKRRLRFRRLVITDESEAFVKVAGKEGFEMTAGQLADMVYNEHMKGKKYDDNERQRVRDIIYLAVAKGMHGSPPEITKTDDPTLEQISEGSFQFPDRRKTRHSLKRLLQRHCRLN